MIYEFFCRIHGKFELNQSMMSEHKANCPECNLPMQRVYSIPTWHYGDAWFRPDGSYRQDKDYEPVMR